MENKYSLKTIKAEQTTFLEVTLALFVRSDTLLLARKMKKIGAGLWNGPGGKIEPGETDVQAMVRESQEELGLTPTEFEPRGTSEFFFPSQPEWNMRCHPFVVTNWQGTPVPTDEMQEPTWFAFSQLPWEEMWPDDRFWLPTVLGGKSIAAAFVLAGDGAILDSEVRVR